ncbi:MAG: hypothetical protein AAGG51_05285 [Cyanobacteria bacterium P01_G01_bin.54]
MKPELTPEQSAKQFARLKRRLDAVQAENVEQRQTIHELNQKLKTLKQQYQTLKLTANQLIASQAAELLEMDDYIKKLETHLNLSQKSKHEE